MIESRPTKVLVLGASGMLGNAVFRFFAGSPGFDTFGTMRSGSLVSSIPESMRTHLITGIDVENNDSLMQLFVKIRPEVVINCVGLVKQLADAENPLLAIPINAMLPHRLAHLCEIVRARLLHVSTDCVFSGDRGGYVEEDAPDAHDLYGRSKLLGEVDYPHAVTLRTSIIGHELQGAQSLLGWFLTQKGTINGYERAIFSGLPTVELARVMRDFVLPRPQLRGLYHVASEPVSKYNLLGLIADVYQKEIVIAPNDELKIDRSLNSKRFNQSTGYMAPAWRDLIRLMHEFG